MAPPPLLADPSSRRRQRRVFVIIAVVLLLLVFIHMTKDIIIGAAAGVLLWVMTRKTYESLTKKLGGREGLAAALTIIGTLLLIIVPLGVMVTLMAADAASLATDAQKWLEPYHGDISKGVDRLTGGGSIFIFNYELRAEELNQRVNQALTQVGQFLLRILRSTVNSILQMVLMTLVALYTLYFFYRDGDHFVEWFRGLLPLDPEHSQAILDTFFSTSIVTLKMVGIIGAVQGACAGLAFWILGLPAPLFFTALTAVASVIPSIGTGLVLVPAVVILFLLGETWKAVVMLIWAAIIVGNVDNVMRPYLVGRSLHMNQLVIFLTMIGGIATFGFLGVIIGPVIAALLNTMLNIYRDVFQRDGHPEPAPPPVIERAAP